MSVGLLIVAHRGIGTELLKVATEILGCCPLQVGVLEIGPDDDCDHSRRRARRLAADLNSGEGLLVLTDLFGSTPSNVAVSLQGCCDLRVLTGINLPMLVRILNYSALALPELTEKAREGGTVGVLLCSCTSSEDSLRQ